MTFFLWLSFYDLLCCSFARNIDHSYKIQESLYVHIWIHDTNCDSVKDCKHFFFINIYSFALLLDSHQLIIDCLFSVKTSNFEIWKKILAVFHSLFHGECHSSADIKRVSITFFDASNSWRFIYIYICIYIYIYNFGKRKL